MQESIRQVGFVGVGTMGRPMLEKLAAAADMPIRAFDHSAAQLEKLKDHPAWGRTLLAADTLKALADCDAVITMLPDSVVTNAVIEGGEAGAGLLDLLRPGAMVIDMGSSNPDDTARLAQRLARAGIALVDAPVSGSVAKARTGSLSIMAGGEDAAVDRVAPLLAHMGATLIRTGAAGSAHAMKALNNYVYAAGLLAASEALLIAKGMQLNLDVFTDVLNASSGRNVATEAKLRQFVLPRTFNGGFALRLAAKDLATAHGLQELAGVDAQQLSLCDAVWKEAAKVLDADADNTELFRFLEQRDGPR